MYAVIQTGGKQYRVQQGDELEIEKLGAGVGEEVVFDEVLMIGGDDVKVGKPTVDGAQVTATVVAQRRDRKVIIFKSRRRGGYRKKRGHRQPKTRVRIGQITA